ncbi:MAG: hypothetical protein ACREUA_07655 [Burkholderiales bacterium]
MTDIMKRDLPEFSKALLLDVFDEPILFHRCYVGITGSVTAALMLSNAVNAAELLDDDNDGWFSKTQDDWNRDTGLSRAEQASARRALRQLGVLEECKQGMPAQLYFRVNAGVLYELLNAQAQRNWDGLL